MIIALAVALPALLIPHVRGGQQLHYRTTWTRRLNEPFLAGNRTSQASVSYTVTVSSASPAGIVWTREYADTDKRAPLRLAADSSGDVIDKGNGQPAGLPVFIYNAALFGQPPVILRPGVSWTSSIMHATSSEHWTTSVAETNAATSLVRLRISFQGHSESGFAADKYAREEREDGEAVFVHGILTKLWLKGLETTAYLDHGHFTNALTLETTLQEPLP